MSRDILNAENRNRKLYDLVRDNPGITLGILVKKSGVPASSVSYRMAALCREGLIEARHETTGWRWNYYIKDESQGKEYVLVDRSMK
jgi:predicted transcriptional regulator